MKTLFKQSSLLILTQFLLLSIGCSEEQRGGPREETSPITGIIHVDGKPVGDLQIKAIPETPEGVNETFTIAGFTDPEGKFSLSTYEAGDGAPEGDYKLIFMWGQRSLMSGGYGAPDKLKKKYLDPKTSEYSVKVVKGKPSDLGTIELTTK
ncbi:MAG: hypothetical protein K0U86_09670 [Planctomycetes bacterium]|nr:hypothetical protein [Planctomycetota bacterium]MCH9725159.1 hypothetical protein [Planctomycetota bacterium]MCH9775362.1 hypothetical protein [Planctomycetota bacterium]MCH9790632.1 hypothetical protein [Planctomycetota bacterium]